MYPSEVGASVKQRFLRLFVVVAACWILFCLFVQPIILAKEGLTHYEDDARSCYSSASANGPSELKDCLSRAERELQTGLYAGFGVQYDKGRSWSYGWYFRVFWRGLVAEIVVLPLLIFGVVWIITTISVWIWRGSKERTATPPQV